MRNTILIVVALSFLTSCATTSKAELARQEAAFGQQMKNWEGRKIDDLIMRLGPPESVLELSDKKKMYTFLIQNGSVGVGRSVNNTTAYIPKTGNTAYFPSYGTTSSVSIPLYCKMSFTADRSGQIINWQYEGNICRIKG